MQHGNDSSPPGITCRDWEWSGEVNKPKRCKYMARERLSELTEEQLQGSKLTLGGGYVWRGACEVVCSSLDGLPRLLCEEWLKVHPEDALRPPPAPQGASNGALAKLTVVSTARASQPAQGGQDVLPVVRRDLFGMIVPEANAKAPAKPVRKLPVIPASPPTGEPFLSDRWLDALEGSELRASTEVPGVGTVHVVPKRSGEHPIELTPVDVMVLRALVDVFPGAEIKSIRTAEQIEEEQLAREARNGQRVQEYSMSPEMVERLKRLDKSTGVPKDELEKRIRDLDEKGMPGGGMK